MLSAIKRIAVTDKQAGARPASGALVALCALLLFALNAFLCHELFHVEFTERMESIESSYMSISRWAMNHWGSLDWFPLWFSGTPFHQVYQPGFHLTVAALGTAMGWTAQHAYHFFVAFEYCLGPVTLFFLCYRVTGWLGYAAASGLAYSLISPASLLVPLIRYDTGGLATARRFIVLVRYGEGPHTTAVMMIPLVLLVLHYAVTERRRFAIAAAPFALAALVLTNWPGTTGLCLGIVAYIFSRLGSDRPIHWPTMLGVAAVAYLIASPWIPPSILALVQRNAQQGDATPMNAARFGGLLAIGAGLLVLHWVFQRFHANPWLRFFAYFTIATGAISIGREWFGWQLLPQSNRFQVEFEMAFLALAVWIGKLVCDRLPRRLRIAVVAAFALTCGYQVIRFRKFAWRETRPIDITRTVEYRMAKFFDASMEGRRVYAPGNVSLWMNMFTETPQMEGCCEQGTPVHEYRIANYAIYTGQNAGDRDAENSILWLKAYGAEAIGVTGPHSTEVFHPFWNARKFEGVLPVLWREGDNAVYSLNRRSRSLAHVVNRDQLVLHPPENGLVVEPLIPYVAAIEAPDAPRAEFRWLRTGAARVRADVRPGQVVSIQITYDPGWRVTAGGRVRPAFQDALGLMAVDPGCSGDCTIDLQWDGGAERKWTAAMFVAGLLSALLWFVFPRRVGQA